MQLFYAPEILPPDYVLSQEESRHCVRVLRLVCGDTLHITDGRGNLFCCRITDADPQHCAVQVISTQQAYGQLPYRLTMAVAPTKNIERFEWFLEKATEVGVEEIIPLNCAHSERRTFKLEREVRVITAAVKQSLKAYHPQLHEITPLGEVVRQPFAGAKFIAHCDVAQSQAGRRYLGDLVQPGESVLLLIGPEGDFSPAEIELALAHGFQEVSLGEQRLRTETAAVAATLIVSVVNTLNPKK